MAVNPSEVVIQDAMQALIKTVGHRGLSGQNYRSAAIWTIHVLHLWPAVVAEVWLALNTKEHPAPKSVMWVLMQRYVAPSSSEADTFLLEAPTEAYLRLQWMPKAQAVHEKAVATTNMGLQSDLAAYIEALSTWQKRSQVFLAQRDRRFARQQLLWAAAKAKSRKQDKTKVPRPEIPWSSSDESEPSAAEDNDLQADTCLLSSPAALTAGVPAWPHIQQMHSPGSFRLQAPPGPDVPEALACFTRDMGWLKGTSCQHPSTYVVSQQFQEMGQAFESMHVLPTGPPPGYRLTEVRSMGLVCGFRIHGWPTDLPHLISSQKHNHSWPASTRSPPTVSCMKVAYKCRPGTISDKAKTLMLREMWMDYDIGRGRWPVNAMEATRWRATMSLPSRPPTDIVHYEGGWDTAGGLHSVRYLADPACDMAVGMTPDDPHLKEAWSKAVHPV